MKIFICLNYRVILCITRESNVASMVVCFLYVHNRYKVEPLNINFQSTKWEGYCLKVSQTHPYPKHYVITNIYRPPCETLDGFNLFNAGFDTFVSTISEIGYPSYICREFNINLLKVHTKLTSILSLKIFCHLFFFQKLHCLLVSVILVVRLLTIFLVMS